MEEKILKVRKNNKKTEDIDNQKKLLKDLITGTDNYPPKDFNKNNLIGHIPRPHIIFKGKTKEENIYGAGKLMEV